MTTEEKAKAYDKAVKQGKRLKWANPYDTVGDMIDSIFPELKESKDEKIRKWLVNMIRHSWCEKYLPKGIKNEDVLAWLEKQGEQNTTDKVELRESEDGRIRKELIEFLCELSKLGKNTNFDRWSKADCANWLVWLEK